MDCTHDIPLYSTFNTWNRKEEENLRLLWQFEDMFTISCIKAIYNPHLKDCNKWKWKYCAAGQQWPFDFIFIPIPRIHCVNVKIYQR